MPRSVTYITGVSGGIGAVLAAQLVASGDLVIGFDVAVPTCDLGLTWFAQVNASDAGQLDQALREADVRVPGVSRLVCAAAVLETTRVEISASDAVAELLRANAVSVFNTLASALPLMAANGGGNAVVITSNAARVPRVGMAGYCASKAAAESIAKCAALEYAAAGIVVNCVAPGSTDTPMLAKLLDGRDPTSAAVAGDPAGHRLGIPTGRVSSPEEVARLVVQLLDSELRQMTMSTVTIDGGASLGA